jgi:transcription termination/antitermination protein NusG
MDLLESSLPWFALKVKSRHEKAATRALRGKGYEAFLPTYRSQHRSAGRMKPVDLPLFPTYAFCRFDPMHKLPIISVPGVFAIVGRGKIPAPIDEDEIAAVQRIVKSNLPAESWPYMQAGDRVIVEDGPLAGTSGFFVRNCTDSRLVISINLLQRSVSVEISRCRVRSVAPHYGLWERYGAPPPA